MTIRIIDNKKISITDQEYNEYIKICRSYDRPHLKGEELFRGLFETDNEGIIVFIHPPSTRYTSMEAVIFLFYIMQSQGLREMKAACSKMLSDASEKLNATIADMKSSK